MDAVLLVACALTVAAVQSTRVAQRFGVPTFVVFVGIGMSAGSAGPGGLAFIDYGLALNVGLLSFPARLLASMPVALTVTAPLTLTARPASLAVVLVLLGRWLPRFRFDLREITVLSWAGLKGAVPIILAIVPLLQRVPTASFSSTSCSSPRSRAASG